MKVVKLLLFYITLIIRKFLRFNSMMLSTWNISINVRLINFESVRNKIDLHLIHLCSSFKTYDGLCLWCSSYFFLNYNLTKFSFMRGGETDRRVSCWTESLVMLWFYRAVLWTHIEAAFCHSKAEVWGYSISLNRK